MLQYKQPRSQGPFSTSRKYPRGIEWSLRASASMRAECLFLRARAFDKQLQKFCEHEQASTHIIFASNSSKGQMLQALLN